MGLLTVTATGQHASLASCDICVPEGARASEANKEGTSWGLWCQQLLWPR